MNKIPNYRVWHKNEKRFVELIVIKIEKEQIGYVDKSGAYDIASFKDIVFQQWTGEYDKNKKEIYEGDIIRSYSEEFINDNYEAEVVFMDAAFHSKINEKEYAGLWSGDDIEVIGNVFENSELLNK
jgi:uncharacterized phage protein (TIGR01671 family)